MTTSAADSTRIAVTRDDAGVVIATFLHAERGGRLDSHDIDHLRALLLAIEARDEDRTRLGGPDARERGDDLALHVAVPRAGEHAREGARRPLRA